MHDIGKIARPTRYYTKQRKLTNHRVAQVRRHREYAKLFMEQIESLKPTMAVLYLHHERWDRAGYSQGLKREQIPLLARIFAIVDVGDALTTERPYGKAMSFTDALDYIRAGSGAHYDPRVVDGFTKMLGELLKEKQAELKK